MSPSLIAYDRQRVIQLRRAAVLASDHLSGAPIVDDPLAADAVATVRLVLAHLEQGWLPSLTSLAESQALIEPFALELPAYGFASRVVGPAREIPESWGPSNAVARSAAEAAVAAGRPGRFVGRTQTYEVIETPPSTTLPNVGHDPDAGSGTYDIIVEDHWFHEHNLASPPALYGATPGGQWVGWLARLAHLLQDQPDEQAQERGLSFEQLAVEARGPGGKGGVADWRNVAVGRVTTTDGDDAVIDYQAVSGEAKRRGYVSAPPLDQRLFDVEEDREYDTEVKILEDAARRLEPTDDGLVEIFTELPPCDSCRNVMAQFHAMFPNVQVRVYDRQEVRTN
jgi:hypothetical protein